MKDILRKDTLRVGTRKSALALRQTEIVIDQLKLYYPNIDYQIIPIITTGDLITDRNLCDIGGKALFLKEIEKALLEEQIDLAVHSLKDVPGRMTSGLKIAALLEREDARDVLICQEYKSIAELPFSSVVGTSSVRRKVLLQQKRPDLNVVTFRGNIDSRITKLLKNEVTATILAICGLKRLGLFNAQYCHILEINEMLPAIGQGIIAIETREDDIKLAEICSNINHQSTWNLIQGERAFLEYLDASCRTPIGAYSQYISDSPGNIQTNFMLADFDGKIITTHLVSGKVEQARELGIRAAKTMQKEFTNTNMIDKIKAAT